MSRPKPEEDVAVLIVAQNASHRFGGEAFIPVKYFEKLRRRGCSVKLIAHERNRKDLEGLLHEFREDMIFVKDSVFHKAIWQAGSFFPKVVQETIFSNILNVVNEVYQNRIIRGLIGRGGVDVIHQPIPVSPLAPSTLHGFGVPVVVGPMNGGMTYPPGYEDYESGRARAFVRVARRSAVLLNRIIPGKRRAAALLVANERTRRALPVPHHPNVVHLVENGVDFGTWRLPAERPQTGKASFDLAFMGRLVGWKAVDVTLQAVALARAADVDVRLRILGDGPERARLEVAAEALGLREVVFFLGFKAQSECVEILGEADALILNSLYECGGAVVLEAMSLGLPVIASDWGGPADYLDASCGVLVSPTPRADFPRRLADAILHLARNPEARLEMGRSGARKARERFDWDGKIDEILKVYRACAGKGVVK